MTLDHSYTPPHIIIILIIYDYVYYVLWAFQIIKRDGPCSEELKGQRQLDTS